MHSISGRGRDAQLRGFLPAGLFLLVFPLAAHLIYSWAGFNPTDDGFVLAYSRRILAGEIPHRDFISIRPVGSALLHLPIVWLGGRYTFWLSRYVVWCEFAGIAIAWLELARTLVAWRPPWILYVATALIAVVLSTHTFPIMAWHTVDALFLASVGLLVATRAGAGAQIAGMLMVGSAYLCRQNFLLFAPLAILILGMGRRGRLWAALLLPGALYAAFLAATGALGDARLQLGAQSDIVRFAFKPYAKSLFMAAGVILGAAGTWWLGRLGRLMMIGTVTVACALVGRTDYHLGPAVGLLGVAAGALIGLTGRGERGSGRQRLVALAVSIAWAASVSIGLNSPVLAAAPLAVAIVALATTLEVEKPDARRWPALGMALVVATAGVGLVCWGLGRQRVVYRDRPMAELTAPLDDVLPGTALLRTSANTRAFLEDLDRAIARAEGRRFAIIPDLAAYWVTAPQSNPLSIDWPQDIELATPQLRERVFSDLESQPGKLLVLVEKVSVATMARGWWTLPERRYSVVRFVRTRFRKVGETVYFDLYE